MPTRKDVYEVIDSERAYQNTKWGDLDDRNSVGDFLNYMRRELVKGENSYYGPDDPAAAIEQVRKVTALGVALMEKFGAPRRGL